MQLNAKYLPIVLLCLITGALFTNSLFGDFVYDDMRQIARNPLIQDSSLYVQALVSDVWAFKGDGTIAASNYWRPTFTAFNIFAFQVFGLNPVGWHLLNILLHIGVSVLTYILLLRWHMSPLTAFAIAMVFAVHPVHVESVAWIAGSPDLLFSLFLLASIWFAGNYSRKRNIPDLCLAILFYAFALGSKEVAVLCFPIYWVIYAHESAQIEQEGSRKAAFRFVLPFAAAAVLYFLIRWMIVGQISHPIDGAIGLREAILTIPSAFVFYLKQILLPISLGLNYPLRPATSLDLINLVLPAIVSTAVFILLLTLAKRSYVQKLGLFLFFLPLLPVMNLTAFVPEQFVHDRYLYLPVLGFLMVIIPGLQNFAAGYVKENSERVILALAVIVSIPLGVKTCSQNQVWANEIVLWEHSTKIDRESSYNWAQYGAALLEKGDFQKSVEAYDKSLDIKVSAIALMGRARGNLHLKRLDEAVRDLKTVIDMKNEEQNAYTLYQTYEALAIGYSEQNNSDEAARILLEARTRLPVYYAALTEKLAIAYYQQGKKDRALQELENAKTKARTELLPESKAVLYRLGMLYGELGRKEEARQVLEEYLRLTAPLQDKITQGDRRQAVDALKRLQ